VQGDWPGGPCPDKVSVAELVVVVEFPGEVGGKERAAREEGVAAHDESAPTSDPITALPEEPPARKQARASLAPPAPPRALPSPSPPLSVGSLSEPAGGSGRGSGGGSWRGVSPHEVYGEGEEEGFLAWEQGCPIMSIYSNYVHIW